MTATGTTTASSDDPDARARRQPRRPRARRGEGPRLREEILDAAEQLLLATGAADAVSVRAVADAVGVTPPSIYRHFADKAELIFEVCARHFATLQAETKQALAGLNDPVEMFIARGLAYVRFGLAHPEPYRILFMTRPDSIPVDRQERWFEGLDAFKDVVDNAQACIDSGRLRPEHDDAFLVALTVWAQVHGLTSLAISKKFLPFTEDAFITRYAEACLRGIVAP